ncbi:hypothetical protein CHLNCDRAFT_34059 [Chlorella variabilis]|uniref:Peptidase S49 domain-containing protein n=1 Tax=Chlorella variabilis TaxID=554065 RepID=E1Z714_CHLVA|nr:hypothetical protein CHLNCDRAFT_34059 [Chlorella variabilis]EFN58740.1 hypothetical protein CHLNCDRAFT_34059 [Chlorella variabilis]|eukprot:XP_005850842.1 hypothetical protein CHLNCDRAFT_34059 [Chlorella variabilis]
MRLLCGSCRRRERAFPPPALPASLQATTALPAEGFILELDLEASSVVEVTRSPGLQSLLQPGTAQLSLQEATGALRAAGGDPRVKGLLALLGGQTGMGLAQVQELRDAVADFRQAAAGRAPTVAYADAFGEGGAGGTAAFYLASAFDVVAVQPGGLVSVTGLAAATPFARGLLDRWRIVPVFFAREEYKSAANFLRYRGSTRAEREALGDRLASLGAQVVRGIAAGRGLSEEQVRRAIDGAPHLAAEAAALRLIDAPLHRDQARKLVSRLREGMAPARPPSDSIAAARAALTALATGQPAEAPSRTSPPLGGASPDAIASLPVIKALRAARQDPAVKACVLRVDSPGGSAAASEAIHREVSLVVGAGKPVVVSMGNVAASGGYYIATAASKIVAQPGTLTGSIGVLAGKLVCDAALREYGVSVEVVTVGRSAAAMSPLTPFTRHQRRRVEEFMDATYALFKQRVAEGRGLKPEAVAKLAKGRVWTGEQAVEAGLVDQLGGLQAAVELAKREAGLPLEEGAVELRQAYPEKKSRLAAALKLVRGEDAGGDGGAAAQPAPAPAAAAALAAVMAATLGRPLSGAELAVLQQLQVGMMSPQLLSLDAVRLAAAI